MVVEVVPEKVRRMYREQPKIDPGEEQMSDMDAALITLCRMVTRGWPARQGDPPPRPLRRVLGQVHGR